MAPKAFLSWSSGKDAAFALVEARRHGLAEIVGVLTTISEQYDRVAMHGVRSAILDRQVEALGLPAIKVSIPSPCTNDVYEARMEEVCASIQAQGATHMVFGDLYLEEVRAYREERLAAIGMKGIFPLWQRNTTVLAAEMIDSGMVAHLVCLDPRKLDRRFAGRRYDRELLRELPANVDPCGENGEFHTVVIDGPMFAQPIAAGIGEIVERDGFVFADVLEPVTA